MHGQLKVADHELGVGEHEGDGEAAFMCGGQFFSSNIRSQ